MNATEMHSCDPEMRFRDTKRRFRDPEIRFRDPDMRPATPRSRSADPSLNRVPPRRLSPREIAVYLNSAGREARKIGLAEKLSAAAATSPLTGFLS